MDDSDDDLLMETMLRPTRRAKSGPAQKYKEKLKANLDEALQNADNSVRLLRMESQRSDNVKDEELDRRIEEAAESARKKPQLSIAEIANGMEDHLDDGVHDLKTKKRLNEALDTETCVNYGLRRVIQFDPTRETSIRFFQDENEAVEEILVILESDGSLPSASSAKLAQKLAQAMDKSDLLSNLLWTGRFAQLFFPAKNSSMSLANWLFRMACSSNVKSNMVHAAADALTDLIENGKLPLESFGSFDEPGYLTAWCDTNNWPTSVFSGRNVLKCKDKHNLVGLLNLVNLWKATLVANKEEKIASDDASMAVKALFFIGIDPMVVSPNFSINLRPQIRFLIRLVVERLEYSLEPEASTQECARCLSMEILGPLTDEIRKLQEKEDRGNSTSYLTFPAIVRAAEIHHHNAPKPKLLSFLLCEMVSLSLEAIALSKRTHTETMDENLPEPVQRVFSAAITSVAVLINWGADIADRAAQALAITECCIQAVRVGLIFMETPYSEKEKEGIVSALNKMDGQVLKLTQRLNAVGHNDFIRHLDGLWMVHRQFAANLCTRISKRRPSSLSKTPVQSTLKSFLKSQDSPA